MRKKYTFVLGFIICLIVLVMSYKFVAGNDIKNKTYKHLETIGYEKDDISEVEIKHSFVNKILSYNEWRIYVEFKKVPDIIFAFTYRDNQIIRQGITCENRQLDKDEIHEYDRMFYNGELKD